uniref:Uncharacterized protein n=1 Tax=Rhizophora mucronata TaxID=61149 RepID=A0A2P2QJR6_RHIMU
MTSSTQLF